MFTFKTEVIGLMCDVEGALDEDGFEIHSIKHFRCDLDITGIKDDVLDYVAEQAVKTASVAAIEAKADAYADRFREYGEERYDS
jgi:hypothetical protein